MRIFGQKMGEHLHGVDVENPGDVHLKLIGDPEEGWEEVGAVIILTIYVIIAALVKLFFHQCRHGCQILFDENFRRDHLFNTQFLTQIFLTQKNSKKSEFQEKIGVKNSKILCFKKFRVQNKIFKLKIVTIAHFFKITFPSYTNSFYAKFWRKQFI